MTHVGQEVRFGGAGDERALFGVHRLCFDLLARADVLDHRKCPRGRALGGLEDADRGAVPDLATVRQSDAVFDGIRRTAGHVRAPAVGEHVSVAGMNPVLAAGQQVVGRPAREEDGPVAFEIGFAAFEVDFPDHHLGHRHAKRHTLLGGLDLVLRLDQT